MVRCCPSDHFESMESSHQSSEKRTKYKSNFTQKSQEKQQHSNMEQTTNENGLPPNSTSDLANEIVGETDFSTENEFYNFGTLISPLPSLPFAKTKQMQWKNKANLVGEKIINPSIHMCDECMKPILIYGRMIPCKHVFCYDCANKSKTECLRCSEEIMKIEKCNLGTVFICQTETCRRTYLSQRDLEAHIKHRHVRKSDVLLRF